MVIYIHIPFCIRKCYYCDFLSGPSDKETIDKYVKALINEIKYHGEKYGRKGVDNPVSSIFFNNNKIIMLSPQSKSLSAPMDF